jgi:CBS domain-containing protein
MRIADLLKVKGYDVWSLSPDATVYEAIEQMAQRSVGALLVMEDGQLVGIISERDYARKVFLKGKGSRDTFVREIMSYPVISIHPSLPVEEAMVLMTDKRIRHLAVVAEEKLVGVISIGDVVRGIIEEKQFEIQQLTNYIAGS